MKFSRTSQQILTEWLLDFNHSPIPHNKDLRPIRHAAQGGDCLTAYVSDIAGLAMMNQEMGGDISNEAGFILSDIKQHYKIEMINDYGEPILMVSKIKKGDI